MSTTPDPTPSPHRLALFLGVAALLAAFAFLAFSSSWDRSPTFDEPFYISGGYGYLRTGDPTMAGWYHPVLAPLIAGLPLLSMNLDDPASITGWDQELLVYSPYFMHYNRADSQTIVRASRLPFLLVGVLLGLGVFLWSRRLFGTPAAILSLMLFVFSPNLLAHTGLATTDILVTALVFWSTFLFIELLRRPRLLTALAIGILAGAALLAKVSSLLIFPAWFLLALIYLFKPPILRTPSAATPLPQGEACPERSERSVPTAVGTGEGAASVVSLPIGNCPLPIDNCSAPPASTFYTRLLLLAAYAVVILLVATLAIGAAYRFDYGRSKAPAHDLNQSVESDHPLHASALGLFNKLSPFLPLPGAYKDTVVVFLDKAQTGHPGYLFGQVGGPWWYYYPTTLLFKTPLGVLLLIALAILLLPWSACPERSRGACPERSRGACPRWALELLIVPLFFLAGCMTSSVDTGFRQVMPIAPFFLVFIGSLATVRISHVRVLHFAVAALFVWAALSSLAIYPDYLAYFNELAGGPTGGSRYLGDSNLDWGQDVLKLEHYVKSHPINEPIRVFLHTPTPVEKLGFPALDGFDQRHPSPGWYALSTTVIQGIYEDPRSRQRYEWLLHFKPITTLGHTIRIYHITDSDLAPPVVPDKVELEKRRALEVLSAFNHIPQGDFRITMLQWLDLAGTGENHEFYVQYSLHDDGYTDIYTDICSVKPSSTQRVFHEKFALLSDGGSPPKVADIAYDNARYVVLWSSYGSGSFLSLRLISWPGSGPVVREFTIGEDDGGDDDFFMGSPLFDDGKLFILSGGRKQELVRREGCFQLVPLTRHPQRQDLDSRCHLLRIVERDDNLVFIFDGKELSFEEHEQDDQQHFRQKDELRVPVGDSLLIDDNLEKARYFRCFIEFDNLDWKPGLFAKAVATRPGSSQITVNDSGGPWYDLTLNITRPAKD